MWHIKAVIGLRDTEVGIWSDSMTTLNWLASKGTRSQFVRNGVQPTKTNGEWRWQYVPTDQNHSEATASMEVGHIVVTVLN